MTGDTLFVGGVSRPDLAGQQHEMAGMLFASLQRKLLTLPDHIEIFPSHQAGSNSGGGLSGKPSSTLGFEKRFNPLLAVKDKEQFIRQITGRLPPRPAEMDQIVLFNTAVLSSGIPSPVVSQRSRHQLKPLRKSVDAKMIQAGALSMNHSTARAAKHILLSIIELGGYPDFKPLYCQAGYEVESVSSVRKALSLLKKIQPDVIVAEFNFQSDFRDRTSSLESLLAAVQRSPKTKVFIFYENEHAHQLAKLQVRFPVYEAFAYPIDTKKLADSLRQAAG